MKTLYIECRMGAAGDMLSAALLELVNDKEAALAALNGSGIPGVLYTAADSVKCGVRGTHLEVSVNGEVEGASGHSHDHHNHHNKHDHYAHRTPADIKAIIDSLDVSEYVRENALAIYSRIAAAESEAHGVTTAEVHFHEVGAMDAVADVVASCMLIEMLSPDKIYVSAVNTGGGTVKTAHGILPVPVPATEILLRGAWIYDSGIMGELCTPTGAAILTHFADGFRNMPAMRVEKTGYGMGTKDFDAANCVRVFLGESGEGAFLEDEVYVLSCDIDDMTAEGIAYAADQLAEAGAVDVYRTPAAMKKGRLGTEITVLAKPEDKDMLTGKLFSLTTTLGVRTALMRRNILERDIAEVETAYGTVREKISAGYGTVTTKKEFEDLARIASKQGVSIDEAAEMSRK